MDHHLAVYLEAHGNWVRAVDLKQPKFETSPADEVQLLQLGRQHGRHRLARRRHRHGRPRSNLSPDWREHLPEHTTLVHRPTEWHPSRPASISDSACAAVPMLSLSPSDCQHD